MDGGDGAQASAQGGCSVAALLRDADPVSAGGSFEALRIFASRLDARIVGVAA